MEVAKTLDLRTSRHFLRIMAVNWNGWLFAWPVIGIEMGIGCSLMLPFTCAPSETTESGRQRQKR